MSRQQDWLGNKGFSWLKSLHRSRERTAMLRILGKASSINVRKVLWTCAELGIAFEREDWGAGCQSTQQPQFLALNPNAMVPVIVDDEVVLWESNTICRYLAGRYGDAQLALSLLPLEPAARARVEQWMDWQATELNNSWRYAFMALVRNSPAHTDRAQIDNSITQWNRHMGILEGQLDKTGAFAAGAQFTLADIVLGLSVNRWRMTPMQRPDYPAIDAYLLRLLARPGFLEFGRNGVP
jgi:glutathione S-transferase